ALGPAHPVVLRRPVQVVRYEQVEVSVVVVIEPGGANGPELPAGGGSPPHAGTFGHVREALAALVMVEDVAVHARHIEVAPAVVVEVGHRGAHRVALAAHARPLGHVAERAIALIPVEPVPEAGLVLRKPWNPRTV